MCVCVCIGRDGGGGGGAGMADWRGEHKRKEKMIPQTL